MSSTRPSGRRDLRRLMLAAGVLVLLTVLGTVTMWWKVMAPPPALPELRKQSRSLPTRQGAPESTPAFVVRGSVVGIDGLPAVGVTILARSVTGGEPVPFATTDGQGQFLANTDVPLVIEVEGTADPASNLATPDSGPLTFVMLDVCPMTVRVVDELNQPVGDTLVHAKVRSAQRGAASLRTQATTDEAGTARLDALVCGVAELWARVPGYAVRRRKNVDTVTERTAVLQLTRGLRVEGTVMSAGGEPIDAARVSAGEASDRTDADGHYALRVDPDRVTHIRATANGFGDHQDRLRPTGMETTPILYDIVLDSIREVSVHCAGLPDDSCADILPILCTHPAFPTGTACTQYPDGRTLCRCDNGDVAVRGGGTAVAVGADESEAWLDMRDRGGITARVLRGGVPAPCIAMGTRLPKGLEDIPGGLAAGTKGTCDADGRVTMRGMKPGDWLLNIESSGETRTLDPILIGDTVVDAGNIELLSGGRIAGVVIDATTGEGQPGAVVVALGDASGMPRLGQGRSGTEGIFTIEGLKEGDYEVFLATRPFTRIPVTVPVTSDEELVLETGEGTLLDRNGIGLSTDEQGDLVVDALDPSGSAATAGLMEGDIVVGVTIAGVDMDELPPGLSADVTDFVLDQWSGPGAGLVVERDGERVDIDLD